MKVFCIKVALFYNKTIYREIQKLQNKWEIRRNNVRIMKAIMMRMIRNPETYPLWRKNSWYRVGLKYYFDNLN